MPEGSPTRVFISYRHEDMDDATDRLKSTLKDHFGDENVFTDLDNLELGDDFGEMIAEYIASCDVLLAVIGRGWVNARDDEDQRRLEDPDDWVRIEIETALERNIRVVPVLLYGTKIPKKQELPDSLWPMLRKTGIEVPREWFDPAVEKLIRAIEKPTARPTRQAPLPADEPAAPPKPESPKIFINYRPDDTAAAAMLMYDRLAARLDAENLFLDTKNLSPGVKWLEGIRGDAPAIFLSLIGPGWLQALRAREQSGIGEPGEDYVRTEIEYALRRESGTMLIPVLIDDATPPSPAELPLSLQPLTQLQTEHIRFASFDEDVARLADRIEALVHGAPPPPAVRKAPRTASNGAPSPDRRHFDQILRHLTEGSLAIFLGSGINGSDRLENGRPPDDATLVAALGDRFQIEAANRQLADVAQEVDALYGAPDLHRVLRELLVDKSPGPVHRCFASLPARLAELSLPPRYPLLVTTTYDTALEQAFHEQDEEYDLLVYMAGGEHAGQFVHFPYEHDAVPVSDPGLYLGLPITDELELERTLIVRACGSIDPRHGSLVITADDFVNYLSGAPAEVLVPVQLLSALRDDHCLFLGYEGGQPALRVLLNRIWHGGSLEAKSWAVARDMTRTDTYFWQRSAIAPYTADPDDYVGELLAALALESHAPHVE